nr:RnfH family protein [uncultured Undibacterium sp.]
MGNNLSPTIRIQLCYAIEKMNPTILVLELPRHSKVHQALQYLDPSHLAIVEAQLDKQSAWAVFGKKKNADYLLQDGDRLELCRPLIADPMSARRHRAKREHKSGKM